MYSLAYLFALLFSLSGLTLLDYRYRLVWFKDWRRALRSLVPVYLLLLAWDLVGVGLEIFFMGNSKFLLGLEVLPDVPVEEFFFLALLVYLPLLLWQYLKEVRHV